MRALCLLAALVVAPSCAFDPGVVGDTAMDTPPDRDPSPDGSTQPAVEIRINVNGPEHVGVDYPGTWSADPGPGGVCGPNSGATAASDVHGTVDDALFVGEMWGNPMTCTVGNDLPAGEYQVRLLFVEFYFGPGCPAGGGTGSRLFDIALEGTNLESSVDLFVEGGCAVSDLEPGQPIERVYSRSVDDGTLDISMPAAADDGKISAIEIVSKF